MMDVAVEATRIAHKYLADRSPEERREFVLELMVSMVTYGAQAAHEVLNTAFSKTVESKPCAS